MLHYLFGPGDTFEVCLCKPKHRKHPLWRGEYAVGAKPMVAGFFDNIDTAVDTIVEADKALPVATYVTLNPVSDALLGRASNRLIPNINRTKDSEVAEIRWMLIDADPTRPEGISASDDEKQAALKKSREVYGFLKSEGWSDPLVADSGNGYHFIYPVAADHRSLIPNYLKYLDAKFSDEDIKIDTTVGNPARLVKVYGSMTRKGENIPARPHRPAKIINLPDTSNDYARQVNQTHS